MSARHASVTAAVCAAVLSCSDSTGPGRIARTGIYDYRLELPSLQGVVTARLYYGTLQISYATEDSIAGTWSVAGQQMPSGASLPGYQTEFKLGFWNSDAYVVYATAIQAGTVTHRLKPAGNQFDCEAGLLVPTGSGPTGFTRVDGECTVLKRQ